MLAIMLASSADSPTSVLINYGALGIMLLLVATGQFRTKDEVRALKDQNAQQAEIIRGFQTALGTQTIPALNKSAQVFESIPNREIASLQEIKEMQRKMSEHLALLEGISKGEETSS